MNKDFIITYSKIKFTPLSPTKEEINIIDIAHALSLLCRANGHFKKFYSVAQHSINCSNEAKARGLSTGVQLACLLHDASEAYISDITRPIKKNLPKYLEYEEVLQKEIYKKYNLDLLTEEEMRHVGEIDDCILYYEFLELMDEHIYKNIPKLVSKPIFEQKEFDIVEKEFLSNFKKLTGQSKSYLSVGIDACKGKWIAVALTENGFEVGKFSTIADVCEKYRDADSIIIDIPLGLAENRNDLRPDIELRKKLKGKASSVFNTPCRQAVYARDYTEAIEENIKALELSLSPPSYGFTRKIREVDIFLEQNTEWKNKLVESHPEYCFMMLNSGIPIIEKKTKPDGQDKRLEVLSKYYPDALDVIKKFKSDVPSRRKIDDVIDALCLAIIGVKGLENGFVTIPNIPEKDSKGIQMQIVGANLF